MRLVLGALIPVAVANSCSTAPPRPAGSPDWHYVRDILIPQIETAGKRNTAG